MATRTETHRSADLLAPDHLPACPKCGDVLELRAVYCRACNCYVKLDRPKGD